MNPGPNSSQLVVEPTDKYYVGEVYHGPVLVFGTYVVSYSGDF